MSGYWQELVSSYGLDQVMDLVIEDDSCSLVMSVGEGVSVRFHVETQRMAWDIKNVVERGKDGEDIQVSTPSLPLSLPPSLPHSLPPSLPPS